MKCLERNKSKFYYSLYLGRERISDTDERFTGETVITYGTPVPMKAYITAGQSTSAVEQFGINTQFDRVIYTDDMNCPITETSVLFIGVEPTENYAEEYNYIVKSVVRSLNSVAIAISKV